MAIVQYRAGHRFGAWVLVAFLDGNYWQAQCDCGATHTVVLSHLTSGQSIRCRACYAATQTTHGRTTRDPTYNTWAHMKAHCLNPHDRGYPRIGGAGIRFDPAWTSFEGFLAGMGERPDGHRLQRIDRKQHYTADNCRWERARVRLKSVSSQAVYTHAGKSRTVAAWAEEYGLEISVLRGRLQRDWPIGTALTTPKGCKPLQSR